MLGNVDEIHANRPPNYLNLKYEQYVIESMTRKTWKPKKKFQEQDQLQ